MKEINKKSQVCRTCLSETDESIFQVIIVGNIEVPLIVMISECIGIKITEEEEMSLNICDNCVEQVINSYVFRKKCLETEKKQRKRLRKLGNKGVINRLISNKNVGTFDTVTFNEIVNEALENERFSSDELDPLEIDYMKHMENSELPHECPTCKRRFKRNYNMKRHMLVHEPPEHEKYEIDISYLFICDFCDHEFVSNEHLNEHLLTTHLSISDEDSSKKAKEMELNRDLPHECPKCNKCFRRRFNLKRHMEIHDPPPQKQIRIKRKSYVFICDYCSREFKSRENLRKHKLTHKTANQFVCQYCGRKFSRREHLEYHVLHLHEVTKEEHNASQIANE